MKKEEFLFQKLITPILPNVHFYWYKKTDVIPYLGDIENLENNDPLENGFRTSHADELFLCFIGSKLIGKIEFSENGAYMDWILALHGYGYFVFSEFENAIKNRGISKITFKIVTSPNESKETVLRRMNFYQRLQCKFIDIEFNQEECLTCFICEYKIIYY